MKFLHKVMTMVRPIRRTPIDPLNGLDLAFIVDATGSMGPFIDAARSHMVGLLNKLIVDAATPIDLRVAVVEYRDHPPQESSFVVRVHGFMDRLAAVQSTIASLVPNGGGDVPEAAFDGVRAACHSLEWRPHGRRVAILIGDAPPHGWHHRNHVPHGSCACGDTIDSITATTERQGVILHALGLTPSVDAAFGWLARATGGSYFAAHRGEDAMPALEALIAREFADLDFDRQVRDLVQANPDADADELAETLATSPGRTAASLNRLGRRGLLPRPAFVGTASSSI